MALSFPYALSFLSDCLQGPECEIDLIRNDEYSQSGSGSYWAAEMADPLWTASLSLYAKSEAKAREINAKVWALEGSNKPFYFSWVDYSGPSFGVTPELTAANIQVNTVLSNKTGLGLKGVPVGFKISVGDFISVIDANGDVYYGTASENRTANSSGVISAFNVYPYLNPAIAVDNVVEVIKPYFKAIVPAGGFKPFKLNRFKYGQGASIQVVQKP